MGSLLFIVSGQEKYRDLQKRLEAQGNLCITVEKNNGLEKILHDHPADVIVLQQTDMAEDRKILKRIKELQEKTMVIIAGGAEDAAGRIRWLEDGAWLCVSRECSQDEFLARINAAVRRHNILQ